MTATVYMYLKKRHTFGSQPLFCEQGPELCDNILPDVSEQKKYILRNPVHEAIQLGPVFSKQKINTIRVDLEDRGINHAEGGWPLDVNIHDIESTQRYRRKQEKDDAYVSCVLQKAPQLKRFEYGIKEERLYEPIAIKLLETFLSSPFTKNLFFVNLETTQHTYYFLQIPIVEHYLNQNNAIELYQHFFKKITPFPPLEKTSYRMLNSYNDVSKYSRAISSISWHPDGNKFAGAYVRVNYFREGNDSTCYIWDTALNTTPLIAIKPPSPIIDLQFSLQNGNILIGGMINGQVGAWDFRTGEAIVICPAHCAHRDVVRKVNFIMSKSGKDFFSGSADGACKWWDIRAMSEPTDIMIMHFITSSFQVPTMALANGITALEYEPTIPTKFMAGTENGLVLVGNRKAKSDIEKLQFVFSTHIGPVFSLQRNPFSFKNFMTVGTHNAKIWNDDCRESAILWTPLYKHPLTSGAWSPKRISTFYLTHADGNLTCWDYLRNQNKPILTIKICDEPLLRLACHEEGRIIACGTEKGAIHLVQMSENLIQNTSRDKHLFTQILDRESKREKILETRLREIKLKQRADADGTTTKTTVLEPEPNYALEERATSADYFDIVKKEFHRFS